MVTHGIGELYDGVMTDGHGQRMEGRTKLDADASTFQGTKPHTPMVTAMNWPRRMSMYLGASDTRSLAAEIELAVLRHQPSSAARVNIAVAPVPINGPTHMLVVTLLSAQMRLAKNMAARPPGLVSHLATISYG